MRGRFGHALGLGTALGVLWLVLSGYFSPFLLGLGAASVLFVLAVAWRMDVVDHESQPTHLYPLRWVAYMFWLGREIVRSNLDVARRVLDPRLPISPTVVRLRTSQRSAAGRVIYANSITLTPGTVTIDVEGEYIEVHALTAEAAEALREGEMDRRVSALERPE